MATMQLQSLTLSRSYTPSPPITAPSFIPFSGRRSSGNLPHYAGIKLPHAAVSRFSGARIAPPSSHFVCEAQDTAIEVAGITDANWQSLVLESEIPVLVEFWAPWCGPYRMIHPIIDELAKDYAGKLKFYKLNTDESTSTATLYGIRSIPTVIIFENGEKKDAVIGAVSKTSLTKNIEKFL